MDSHKKDLLMVIGIIVLLFIGWIASGGPQAAQQSGSANDPYINPQTPLGNGATYR